MERIWIGSDELRVAVLPEYGARVVSLVDQNCGRDWIFQGGQSPQTGEDAVYSIDEAVGWDECFPTVSAFDGNHTAWGRRLRDHGDLWGRPWRIDSQGTSAVTTVYDDPQFKFARTLCVEGSTLVAEYQVNNLGRKDLPFLWALHALFTVTPADKIVLSNAGSTVATHFSLDGKVLKGPHRFAWPGPDAELPVVLDQVHPASRHMSAKVLVNGVPSRSVSVGHGDQWLDIGWDAPLEDLGIWLNYGAWPTAGELHHIALEPTSSEADHLGQAVDKGAETIAPGGSVNWRVRMTVRGQSPR